MKQRLKLLPVLFLAIAALPAFAAPISIANTGLAAPLSADPSWLVDGGTAFVTDQSSFPFPFWLAPGGSSEWISPQPSYTAGQADPAGTYVYSTTFDMAGLDPSTASISFIVAVDNELTDVLINGVSTGLTYTGLDTFSGVLTINSGFTAGTNTLQFFTNNFVQATHNPSGLRVEFTTATADALVPEPTSLALFGMGVALLAIRRFRASR